MDGKRYFTLRPLALCSIVSILTMIVCFFVLFWPVISGEYVDTELVFETFSIPGSVPWNLNKNGGISKAPGFLSKFFGRSPQGHGNSVNLTAFVDQFKQFEVLNTDSCNLVFTELFCQVESLPQPVITSECTYHNVSSAFDKESFGAKTKSVYKLIAAEDSIEVPRDQTLSCIFEYDDTLLAEKKDKPGNLTIKF